MRILNGVAALALFVVSATAAFAQTPTPAPTPVPKCPGTTGPLVWYVAASQIYYSFASPKIPRGGVLMCTASAAAAGGHYAGDIRSKPSGSTGSMAPGATRVKVPAPTGSQGPASQNQGGTQPGAGGQVPNNPASTPNVTPIPQPT